MKLKLSLPYGCLPAVLGTVLIATSHALAISGTRQVAWAGKHVTTEAAWPAGVLKLINDPLRTDGWNPWFSGHPNDVNHYEFKVSSTVEANRLIKELAAIEAEVQIRLNPGKEARGLGFTTVLKAGNGTAATFAIGNQKRINEWYRQLEEAKPGAREFDVHRFAETPKALAPTLTLYAGHAAINLEALEIPVRVGVSAEASEYYRTEHPDDATLKAIDEFVEKHNARLVETSRGFKPRSGFVPDAETAIKIAVAVWRPIYGEKKIAGEKPYHAVLTNNVWIVEGSVLEGSVGGVARAKIAKEDGRIIEISHGQ